MPTITGSVEDREQIRELYARYAIYLDSSKFEEWVNCFTEDGIFESPPLGKHAGHAALRKFCASLREKWAGAQVRHMMVNVSFNVHGDHANGTCKRPSATAEGAAVMRVLHQKLDSEPKILDDPISARLIDPHSEAYSSRVELL